MNENRIWHLIRVCLLLELIIKIESIKINLIQGKEMETEREVYFNDTLDHFFYYHKNYDICDCSPKPIYYEYVNSNVTRFNINLNEDEKIEKVFVKSDNSIINTNYTIDYFTNEEARLNIIHTCSYLYLPVRNRSWGVIHVELYKSLDTMERISFDFVKFCEPPELMGSYITILLLFLMSTFIVGVSTYSEIRLELTEIKPEGEIKCLHGVLLIGSGSLVLLIIFYFVNYINTIFTLLISFQIGLAFYLCLKTLYEFLGFTTHTKFLKLNKKVVFIKMMLKVEIEVYSFILMIISAVTVGIYILTRHWVLNNIFGFCLVFTILSLFHIRSFKICAIMLISAFFYDVFWVYFSPYFFDQNVMVVAATSLNLPIKLEIPILFEDHPIKSCMFLGLGDLVLPGLVLKFCHRFDFIKNTKIYYPASILLYMLALSLSGIVIAVFKYPQPVLFYMCPVLLTGIGLISYKRKEVDIWNADLLEQDLHLRYEGARDGREGLGEIINTLSNYNTDYNIPQMDDLENKTDLSFTESTDSNSSDEK